MFDVKLTIIVPIFNAAQTLRRCLDSIIGINCDFKYEVILINDGSTDDSSMICKEYETKCSTISVYNTDNRGPSHARNMGIRKAKGEYIGFVDSDDFVEAEMFNELILLANKYGADIVICNFREYVNDVWTLREHYFSDSLFEGQEIREKVIRQFFGGNKVGLVQLWNKIYRSDLIKSNGILLDEALYRGEDFWFNLRLYEVASKIVFSSKAFYNYYADTPGSLMKRLDSNYYKEWKDLLLYLDEQNEKYQFQYDRNRRYEETLFNIHALLIKMSAYGENIDNILKDSYYDEIISYDAYTSLSVKAMHFIHRISIGLEKWIYHFWGKHFVYYKDFK